MPLEELIVFGIGLLILVGSWIGNLIKEAQKREAERHREARAEPQSGRSLDEAASRRREQLREMARQRQQTGRPQDRQGEAASRYGQLEPPPGESKGYARYGEIGDASESAGYGRYRDAGQNAEALEQYARYGELEPVRDRRAGPEHPAQYRRYEQVEQPRRDIRPGGETSHRVAESPPASQQSGGVSRQAGASQHPPAARPGVGQPLDEQPAGPSPQRRVASGGRISQAGGTAGPSGAGVQQAGPGADAQRIRRKLTTGNLKDVFIIKELLDKPLALRSNAGLYEPTDRA